MRPVFLPPAERYFFIMVFRSRREAPTAEHQTVRYHAAAGYIPETLDTA
jgi:hypothetical protein